MNQEDYAILTSKKLDYKSALQKARKESAETREIRYVIPTILVDDSENFEANGLVFYVVGVGYLQRSQEPHDIAARFKPNGDWWEITISSVLHWGDEELPEEYHGRYSRSPHFIEMIDERNKKNDQSD